MHLDLDEIGLSVLYYMFGSHCLIMFGGTPTNVPDGLIHAIRQRVDEIQLVGGELFDMLRLDD